MDSKPAVFASLSSTVSVCTVHTVQHTQSIVCRSIQLTVFFSSFHNAIHNKQSPSITQCISWEILIISYTYPTVSAIPSISLSPVRPLLPVFIWRPAVPEHLNPSSLPPLFMIPLFVLPCNLEDGRGSTCPWVVERNVWNLSEDILCLFTCYCSCVCVLVHVCVVPATTFGDVCLSPQTISAAVSQLVCATIFHCVQCHYQQASLWQLLLWNNYHFNKCTTKWIFEPCVCVCVEVAAPTCAPNSLAARLDHTENGSRPASHLCGVGNSR